MSEKEKEFSNIAGLIPQVFYDLIGRIVPGAFLLFMAFLSVYEEKWKQILGNLFEEPKIPYSVLFFLGYLLSYMTGILLGGIGYLNFMIFSGKEKYCLAMKTNPKRPLRRNRIFLIFHIYTMQYTIMIRPQGQGWQSCKRKLTCVGYL